MRALIDLILGPIGAIAGLALAAGLAWLGGSQSGKAKERAKQADARLKDIRKADEIEDAVAGRTADENRERLKRW